MPMLVEGIINHPQTNLPLRPKVVAETLRCHPPCRAGLRICLEPFEAPAYIVGRDAAEANARYAHGVDPRVHSQGTAWVTPNPDRAQRQLGAIDHGEGTPNHNTRLYTSHGRAMSQFPVSAPAAVTRSRDRITYPGLSLEASRPSPGALRAGSSLSNFRAGGPSTSPLPPSLSGILWHAGTNDQFIRSEFQRKLYPMTVITRYKDLNRTVKEYNLNDVYIDPTKNYSLIANMPSDWCPCMHPGGALYFRHTTKVLESCMRYKGIHSSKGRIECVLQLEKRDLPPWKWRWSYYFVDHQRRQLFWLEPVSLGLLSSKNELDVLQRVDPNVYEVHIKHWLELKYWTHREMYPIKANIPFDILSHCKGALALSLLNGVISTEETLMTYSTTQLQSMIDIIDAACQDNKPTSAPEGGSLLTTHSEYTVCIVARIMTFFAFHRFYNFHGQVGARLTRSQAKTAENAQRTMFLKLLSPVLFGAPDVQLESLERIWINCEMSYPHWSDFIQKMRQEWFDFLLPSTVLLSANMAFLAIPSVAPQGDNLGLTAAEIISYISMTASMGSIILSLLLIRQTGHHLRERESASKVVRFLRSRQRIPALGTEALAVVYSLPYGLTLWAMITFPIAFSFECFKRGDDIATFTIAGVWIAIAITAVWCIYVGWDSWNTESLSGRISNLFRKPGTERPENHDAYEPLSVASNA
ncbi:hypothetical protein CERSUDRAFT_121858 [Gelatoporia subvermispora B]|uniref:WW domain-containing protein n=1 Tax=Ceriporiopsis subvermispora (strain B) TaxID=914234 RepID=M2QRB9_CERS8|nr:hypothetical protein CERSUDRAFT_121858 [Gelatoporia subvermispora B]